MSGKVKTQEHVIVVVLEIKKQRMWLWHMHPVFDPLIERFMVELEPVFESCTYKDPPPLTHKRPFDLSTLAQLFVGHIDPGKFSQHRDVKYVGNTYMNGYVLREKCIELLHGPSKNAWSCDNLLSFSETLLDKVVNKKTVGIKRRFDVFLTTVTTERRKREVFLYYEDEKQMPLRI